MNNKQHEHAGKMWPKTSDAGTRITAVNDLGLLDRTPSSKLSANLHIKDERGTITSRSLPTQESTPRSPIIRQCT